MVPRVAANAPNLTTPNLTTPNLTTPNLTTQNPIGRKKNTHSQKQAKLPQGQKVEVYVGTPNPTSPSNEDTMQSLLTGVLGSTPNSTALSGQNEATISIVTMIWNDSSLLLHASYAALFISEENATSGNEDRLVLWNNGQGVCRLVPLTQLKPAFNGSRPREIRHYKVPTDAFNVVFQEVFGQQPGAHRVVGALDSNSTGSNFFRARFETMAIAD
jgi:hypothetical protein